MDKNKQYFLYSALLESKEDMDKLNEHAPEGTLVNANMIKEENIKKFMTWDAIGVCIAHAFHRAITGQKTNSSHTVSIKTVSTEESPDSSASLEQTLLPQ